jgi:hypothetical protein
LIACSRWSNYPGIDFIIKTVDNGETIQVITNQNASVRQLDNQFFLYFEEGIKIDSPYLLDTIHLLLPCNLRAQFKLNSQKVRVSGEMTKPIMYNEHLFMYFVIN